MPLWTPYASHKSQSDHSWLAGMKLPADVSGPAEDESRGAGLLDDRQIAARVDDILAGAAHVLLDQIAR
jgi:hypothetical protein